MNASTRSCVSGKENTLIPNDKRDKRAKRDKLATLRAVADRHGADLVTAAFPFSLGPDVASALIVGTANPADILADHPALQAKIPPAFQGELRSTSILHHDAAVPANKD